MLRWQIKVGWCWEKTCLSAKDEIVTPYISNPACRDADCDCDDDDDDYGGDDDEKGAVLGELPYDQAELAIPQVYHSLEKVLRSQVMEANVNDFVYTQYTTA